jgi:REP element-mobilizing transposase RayT
MAPIHLKINWGNGMGLRGRNNLTDESFFFVTTTIINFYEVFNNNACCDILINNIKHYQSRYRFEIIAYVIMPTHFHWIVKVEPGRGTISDIMRDIKKYSAWDILDQLKKENSELSKCLSKSDSPKQKRQLWMHRFDDEVIRNNKMLWTKIKYIHNNPIRAGIVEKAEEYKYSSARNYIYGDQSILFVELSWAGIEF